MEKRGGAETYLVFCSEARAQDLAPWVRELEAECNVKVEYTPGAYQIHRQGVPVQVHQQCKHILINLVKSGAVTKGAQWFWHSGKTFTPYDIENSTLLEENFQRGVFHLIFEVHGKPYQIDMQKWRQVDMTTGAWRPILRNQIAAAPSGWCYFDRNNWRRLPEEAAQVLSAASTEGQSQVPVSLHSRMYTADLQQRELRDERRAYKLEYFRHA